MLSKKRIRQIFRDGVFRRDGETCVLCGFSSRPGFGGAEFEAHSLVSDYLVAAAGINPANGVTLCKRLRPGQKISCFDWAESQIDEAGGCSRWFDFVRHAVLQSALVRFRAEVAE